MDGGDVMIEIEKAKALDILIKAAARQLNIHISDAAKAGMIVEVSMIEVRQISVADATQFIDVTVKIRLDQISLTP